MIRSQTPLFSFNEVQTQSGATPVPAFLPTAAPEPEWWLGAAAQPRGWLLAPRCQLGERGLDPAAAAAGQLAHAALTAPVTAQGQGQV